MEKRCVNYVGLACVDGSCPMIDRDEGGGYIRPIIESCEECGLYKGCADCALADTDLCEEEFFHGPEE